MDTEKLKGVAVVAMGEGTKLGAIDHALFDPTTLDLQALQVTGDGQTFVIPWGLVQAVGTDAVMVASRSVTQAAAQGGTFGNLVDLRAIQRLKVVDAAGTYLGTVSDVEPDPITGRAVRILVSKGGFLGRFGETTTIDMAEVRGIGPALVTVVTAVSTPLAESAPIVATP